MDDTIKRIHVVHPEPGDTIILECEEYALGPNEAAELRDQLQPHFPDNKILVLTALSLSVQSEKG